MCVCFGEGILSPRLQKCPGFWRLEGARECELKFPPPPASLGAAHRRAPRSVLEAAPSAGAASWSRCGGPCAHPASSSSARSGKIPVCRLNCRVYSTSRNSLGIGAPYCRPRRAGTQALRSSSYLSGGARLLGSVGDFISYQSQRAVCIGTLGIETVLLKRRISALAGEKGSRGNVRKSKSTFSLT